MGFAGCLFPAPQKVLLISIDTWRWDYLGFAKAGHEGLTPHMDRLAKEGMYFPHTFTPAPLTAPAHASMLTGLYPFRHGIRDNWGFTLKNATVTLAELFQKKGYKTYAFVSAMTVGSHYGFHKGFQYYDEPSNTEEFSFQVNRRRGEETLQKLLPYLKRKEKAFLFVHFFDLHLPYDLPEYYQKRFKEHPYAGAVAYVDTLIGRIMQSLKEEKLLEKTLIVLTGDHGEGLGEHGEVSHGLLTYNSTLRVPLVLWGTGKKPQTIFESVSLVDIMPTLLHILGMQKPGYMDGIDLFTTSREKRALHFEALYGYFNLGLSPIHGIISWPMKLMVKAKPALYDLSHDHKERHNLIDKEKQTARQLKKYLRAFPWTLPERGGKTTKTLKEQKKLESLGYLSGSLGLATSVDPDDFIKDQVLWMQAREALEKKNFQKARKIYVRLIQNYPSAPLFYDELGMTYIISNDAKTALGYFQKSLALNPKDINTMVHLANSWLVLSQPEKAIPLYKKVLTITPKSSYVLYTLAVAYVKAGHHQEACKTFRVYLKLEPSSPLKKKILTYMTKHQCSP